ncbi:DUF397 domain-containing protein [Actinomadura graeca]|uniref:DUF397 domain-containing protein n=1 Tax=Actinomadura graeca TaxID=2750812 RepID=A0ABX8QY43_9ACTN|nr:DUF397 domain-containing protein [Actinomadura graeca]QXJ23089.1 DUF397 domain-containing protein [Actinomadura graeca]
MDLNDLHWRKASHSASNGGECVELASATATVVIRDSKHPHGPRLTVRRDAFADLVAALKR